MIRRRKISKLYQIISPPLLNKKDTLSHKQNRSSVSRQMKDLHKLLSPSQEILISMKIGVKQKFQKSFNKYN